MIDYKNAIHVKDTLELDELVMEGEQFDFLIEYFKEHYAHERIFSNGCIGFIKRKHKGVSDYVVNFIDDDLKEQTI